MKKPSLTALAAVLALSSPVLAEQLTPERIFADPSLSGPTAKGVALPPDGKRVTYLKSKPEAANVQDLWAAWQSAGLRLVSDRLSVSPWRSHCAEL